MDDSFAKISEYLGLTEWNPVVWIGRLFTLDNDLGEHWFDNWDLRDALSERAHSPPQTGTTDQRSAAGCREFVTTSAR